jgi:hypothetical protein
MIHRNIFCLLLASVFIWSDRVKAEDIWTTVNDDAASATYAPGISFGGGDGYFHGDVHTANNVGDWASFSFVGTGVKWIGAKNVDHDHSDVYIDGELDATVSTKGPQWIKQQELYIKTGLPLGPHTMKIVVKTPHYRGFRRLRFSGAGASRRANAGDRRRDASPAAAASESVGPLRHGKWRRHGRVRSGRRKSRLPSVPATRRAIS